VTTFSHTIASASPLEASRKPDCLVCRLASRQSQRIPELVDSAQLTQTSALTGFRPVPRVRILPAPPRSLDCREFLPLFTAKCAKHARISRFFFDKPDCRERTAYQWTRSLCWLFSGGHMDSPVSRRTPGGYNAIKSLRFWHCELTSTSALETEVDISHKPVSGQLPGAKPRTQSQRWSAFGWVLFWTTNS
jgi:hypothetical protein